jgi:predicted metallo-beta-lactamase superfamily hydrolase
MKIVPLAAESLGVRSSATFVETTDVRILIDPGVSLAPVRFGLPPHPLEIRAMNESWRTIKEYAARSDILVITHYHFDHFDPTEPLVFRDKVLIHKDPKEHINSRQRERARAFSMSVGKLPRCVEIADNGSFDFGTTRIRFSAAVPHGSSQKAGWVVEASIREGDSCFLYTSDIQGAGRSEHLTFIRGEEPDVIYIDGPPTYMMGQAFTREDLHFSLDNIRAVIETTPVQTLIMDHHVIRDPNWDTEIGDLRVSSEKSSKMLVTAAGFLGREDEMLEAHRRQLFAWHPDMPEEPIARNRNFQLVRELQKK